MAAARLLQKGYSQSEVARRVGAHRQSVWRWAQQLRQEARRALKPGAGRALVRKICGTLTLFTAWAAGSRL